MTLLCLPIDASAGAPSFPAAQHRMALSALAAARTDRKLGALSGVIPGANPTTTVSGGNTWNIGVFKAIVDPGTAATVGAYLAVNTATASGAINPADSTNARLDRLDLVVPDDPAGAFGTAPVIQYTAGVASATPQLPATPARSMPLATINVPKVGGGNPSVTATYPYTAAAGGVIPTADSTQSPANPYVGQYVDDASLGLLRWNGTKWVSMAGKDQAYTPVLGSTGAVPTGWTTSGSFCIDSERWVDFEATFTAASIASLGGGAYTFGLPVAADQSSMLPVGSAFVTNAGMYSFLAAIPSDVSGSQACCLYQPGADPFVRLGAAGPYGHAWGTNQAVRISGRYRAASA